MSTVVRDRGRIDDPAAGEGDARLASQPGVVLRSAENPIQPPGVVSPSLRDREPPRGRRIQSPSEDKQTGGENMLGIIAAILVVGWLLGFFVFHVSSALIHVVLVIAVIMIILHFVNGRRGGI